MMALAPRAIHTAVAEQLKASPLGDLFTVHPFPALAAPAPKIEVVPSAEYVAYWGTFGPNGNADLMLTIRCTLDGLTDEDRARRAWQLVSVGTDVNGNGQVLGVADVVHADRTLGGVVQDAVILTAKWIDDADVLRWCRRQSPGQYNRLCLSPHPCDQGHLHPCLDRIQ